ETDPTCAPPGGESIAAVQARVVACVRDLAERHAGAAVVLVSHVGPIKALLCTAMDVPLTTGRGSFVDSPPCAGLYGDAGPLRVGDRVGGWCGAVGGSSHRAVV